MSGTRFSPLDILNRGGGQAPTPAALLEAFRRFHGEVSNYIGELEHKLSVMGAHDAWQDSESDNVADGFPLVLKLYIPEGKDTRHIQQVLLYVWLEEFRSYGTGAASADLGTISISTNTTGQSSTTTTSETAHYHADEYGTTNEDGTVGMHSHYVPIHNTYNSGAHGHGMSHTHGIDHSHTLGTHVHDLVHGIYTGGSPSDCTIVINGTDRTSVLAGAATFDSDQIGLDITRFLTKGLNTIQITSATLGRIRAMFFSSLYLNMGR